jgi:Bacterial Ig domain
VVGTSELYTVEGIANDGSRLGDVTAKTLFSISPSGTCKGPRCTPTTTGEHLVTATVAQQDRPPVTATAVLQVLARQASISTVRPGSTFPGMSVAVRGNTGSCNRRGTVTFHGMTGDVSSDVTADPDGIFVARFTVPKGTFPRIYRVELTVDCNGQLQRAEGELSVLNLAPQAANDSAVTAQDTPVAIAVTANDRNPDPGNGYQTIVVEHRSPTHGTLQIRSDGIIEYAPDAGFFGRDQFQYGLCDNIINTAGQADCDTAIVTVTVNPSTPPASSVPPGSVPPSSVAPSTIPPCAPAAGDIRPSLHVTPVKGAGGVKLHITGRVDRRLATCPLTLLLGGAPLSPTVRVDPGGSISQDLAVPNDAIPGSSTLSLAATSGQILAESPFEILKLVKRWWERNPFRLLLGLGALLGGALARAAVRRVLGKGNQPDPERVDPHDLRAEPHPSRPQVSVSHDPQSAPSLTVRLQPHSDAGIQTLQEVVR